MSIFNDHFTTGQVVAAADVTNPALQSWIRRSLIIGHAGHEIDMPGTPGIRRKFSFSNVIEIAIAKSLIDLGVKLADAFKAAAIFSYIDGKTRHPSMPFRDAGVTLLCVAGQRSGTFLRTPGADVTATIRETLYFPKGWTTLEVRPVFDRAVTALGHHPHTVICEAYGDV